MSLDLMVSALRAEVERLKADNEALRRGDCPSVMQFGGIHYACDYPAGHNAPHGGVYPHPSGSGDDVLGQWQ